MKRRVGIIAGIVVVTGLTLGAFHVRRADVAPSIVTAPVSRGTIVSEIAATGTLEAVTTVEVGTQVSGTIQALYADFNSIVHKGQVLARLDPSLFQTQVDSARANLASAQADLQRVRVGLTNAQAQAARARELAAKQLIAASDLDTALAAERTAAAQVKSAEAAVTQASAAVKQAQVNLDKTVITAPIDGIVIARSVDVGQTVASSLSAPTLFTLAADLSQMQVKANIDEADLGSIRNGQPVSFRVDAYPGKTFEGTVTQVRLNPVVDQNVVTYAAIIAAPNPGLELKPGMTANVTIETARRENVLRVPAAALRFKPTAELLASLGQQAPPDLAGGVRQAAGSGTVWSFDGRLEPMRVTTGLSDGAYTEVTGQGLTEGLELATAVNAPGSGGTTAARSSNPLMGMQPGPRR